MEFYQRIQHQVLPLPVMKRRMVGSLEIFSVAVVMIAEKAKVGKAREVAAKEKEGRVEKVVAVVKAGVREKVVRHGCVNDGAALLELTKEKTASIV